jgi:hypothetical protein
MKVGFSRNPLFSLKSSSFCVYQGEIRLPNNNKKKNSET